jgi:hypothetical protein
LNAERFPLYAKVHGDFRYQSIKNLPPDLIRNDTEIQKCFLAASTRFGMIVSGYSGRDENVMSMFRTALDQSNAFPHGMFWTVPRLGDVSQSVQDLITFARRKGVNAYLVEAGTFDTCGDSRRKNRRISKRKSTRQKLSPWQFRCRLQAAVIPCCG